MDFLIAHRWPFWLGGLALGVVIIGYWVQAGRQLGVSSSFVDVCSLLMLRGRRWTWRIRFIVGIVVGGFLAGIDQSPDGISWSVGQLDTWMELTPLAQAGWMFAGGIFIGLGSRLADGCTSGHSMMGVAMLSPASMVATGCFMGAGVAVVQFLRFWCVGA